MHLSDSKALVLASVRHGGHIGFIRFTVGQDGHKVIQTCFTTMRATLGDPQCDRPRNLHHAALKAQESHGGALRQGTMPIRVPSRPSQSSDRHKTEGSWLLGSIDCYR